MVSALGAIWGAWWEDSGDVCLRLRPILQTWCHRRGEDSHEHHRPGTADRGVEGSGERWPRGGAVWIKLLDDSWECSNNKNVPIAYDTLTWPWVKKRISHLIHLSELIILPSNIKQHFPFSVTNDLNFSSQEELEWRDSNQHRALAHYRCLICDAVCHWLMMMCPCASL